MDLLGEKGLLKMMMSGVDWWRYWGGSTSRIDLIPNESQIYLRLLETKQLHLVQILIQFLAPIFPSLSWKVRALSLFSGLSLLKAFAALFYISLISLWDATAKVFQLAAYHWVQMGRSGELLKIGCSWQCWSSVKSLTRNFERFVKLPSSHHYRY